VYFVDQELIYGHQCGTMLELKLIISESKIFFSYKHYSFLMLARRINTTEDKINL
jgi:hypothetical protein